MLVYDYDIYIGNQIRVFLSLFILLMFLEGGFFYFQGFFYLILDTKI
jgi:hypothetical protein